MYIYIGYHDFNSYIFLNSHPKQNIHLMFSPYLHEKRAHCALNLVLFWSLNIDVTH